MKNTFKIVTLFYLLVIVIFTVTSCEQFLGKLPIESETTEEVVEEAAATEENQGESK